MQITCLYDMDIPRPDNFNETYLYEGKSTPPLNMFHPQLLILISLPRVDGM